MKFYNKKFLNKLKNDQFFIQINPMHERLIEKTLFIAKRQGANINYTIDCSINELVNIHKEIVKTIQEFDPTFLEYYK